jgi:hypothetical protein
VRVTPECDSISSVNISSATGLQVTPAVAFDDNNYMVVWSDARSGNYYRVYGARVSPAGTVLDPAGILIGPATETFQLEPAISFADTIFFVVWVYHSSPFAVTGRFVHCDGTLGDSVRIASLTDEAYMTSVAYDGTNYLVAWTQYPDLLKGQLVSAGGNLIGSTFTIATGVANLGSGRISFDGNKYTVVYTVRNIDIFEVWGRQYDISGNPLGSAFIISNPAYSSYDSYIVAGATNYFNVWTHMQYPSDIYGNVDLQIGIEACGGDVPGMARYGTTIISGPLRLPHGVDYRIYDITGREVQTTTPAPGVYFVEVDGAIVNKIIKVR